MVLHESQRLHCYCLAICRYNSQDSQSCAVVCEPSSSHVMDRQWSSYGSDGEPADDVDDGDDDETVGQRSVDVVAVNNVENRDNDVTLTTSSSASFVTSTPSSVTSSGDVRRPRTIADGCEDEHGAGALDLIRHVVVPASRPAHSLHRCTSWKPLDDVVESSVQQLASYAKPQRLTVDTHSLPA